MIFALGGLGFWMLFAVASVLFIISLEVERIGYAALALIGGLFAMAYWGDFNIITYASENPQMLAAMVGGYFAGGTTWCFIKWWFHLRNCRDEDLGFKNTFLEKNGVHGGRVPPELKDDWKAVCASRFNYLSSRGGPENGYAPMVSKNKARLMRWMMFWPWSFLWTMINDPIKKVFKWIYRSIQGTLQGMSDRAYSDFKDDLQGDSPQSPDDGQKSTLKSVEVDERPEPRTSWQDM